MVLGGEWHRGGAPGEGLRENRAIPLGSGFQLDGLAGLHRARLDPCGKPAGRRFMSASFMATLGISERNTHVGHLFSVFLLQSSENVGFI